MNKPTPDTKRNGRKKRFEGNGVKVKGGLGAVLLIAEENQDDYEIASWKAVVVDGKTIKPDTWYKIEDGELVVYE